MPPDAPGHDLSSAPKVPGEIVLTATNEAVRELSAWLKQRAAAAGMDEMAVIDLELAMVEAANNVVEHGYPPDAPGEMGLALTAADNTVSLTLYDAGSALPADIFEGEAEVSLDALGGRGIPIIQACVDQVAYASEGGINRLVLTKRV